MDKLEIGETYHKPVLLKEVLDALFPVLSGTGRDAWFLDATLGDGGHTIGLLRAGGKVKGIDQDPQALKRAQTRLSNLGFDGKFLLEKRNFSDLSGLRSFNGILFDLGVSSLQFLDPSRGFSIKRNGPLDMRMDPSLSVSAKELINGLNKGELNELFSKSGEKLAKPISAAVVSTREIEPIKTTKQLADLIERVYRRFGIKRSKIHPATKVFQALRIVVNDELNSLKETLPQALEHLKPKGRIVVLSFHSLEDKIIKEKFTGWQKNGFGRIITKKPMIPTVEEISENPHARSTKMRVFEKA